jgi:single-stranded-DNA-specific exonuclease
MAGGGHAMAAGLSVRPDLIPELREFLSLRLAEEQEAQDDAIEIDALIAPSGADRALYDDFQRLTPFGPGNPEPVFAMADVLIEEAQAVRGGHVRVQVRDSRGGRLRAVAWRVGETPLGQALLAGGKLHVTGRLKPDDWQGRNGVEFEIEDAADPRMQP